MHSLFIFFLLFCAAHASNSKQTFCQVDKCLTCIGRYCTTTCQGEYCKNCPLGDCCDGSNCNICRGEKCCSDYECNSCVTNCLKNCQGVATCHYDCFQSCLPTENLDQNNNNSIYGSRLISNKNYFPVNVTTIINITNTIQNENVVHHPILINTTNINNSTNHKNYHRKKVFINNAKPRPDKPQPPHPKQNCCEVIHPEKCQKLQGEEIMCYTKKHQECSSLCIGKHVHIVEDSSQEKQCITIATKPYWYCGHYSLQDCDECYNCEDIDDIQCTQNPSCADSCRISLISPDFYNKWYIKS